MARENNEAIMLQHQLWANRGRRQRRRRGGDHSFWSANSFGLEMDFLSMWSQVNDEQVNRIESEFCFDMTMMIVLTWLLWLAITYTKNCGIPVKEWLMGFEILYFSRSSFQMVKI